MSGPDGSGGDGCFFVFAFIAMAMYLLWPILAIGGVCFALFIGFMYLLSKARRPDDTNDS